MKLAELLDNMFSSEHVFIKFEYTYKPFFTGSAGYFISNPDLWEKYQNETIYRVTSLEGGIAIILKAGGEKD